MKWAVPIRRDHVRRIELKLPKSLERWLSHSNMISLIISLDTRLQMPVKGLWKLGTSFQYRQLRFMSYRSSAMAQRTYQVGAPPSIVSTWLFLEKAQSLLTILIRMQLRRWIRCNQILQSSMRSGSLDGGWTNKLFQRWLSGAKELDTRLVITLYWDSETALL